MKGLRTFIENVQKDYKENNGFEGCYYFNLKDGLYLVFATGDEEEGEGLLGKIARNTDDLQCDYNWDWETVEEWYWEDSNCEESSPENIERSVRRIIEPSWLTAYREFCDKEYDQYPEVEEGEILNVLYSTFDVGEDLNENYLEVGIQVSYNPVEYQYIIDLTERHVVDLGEETDEEKHSFTIAQDHEGFYDDMYCDWQTLYEYFVGEARDRFYSED